MNSSSIRIARRGLVLAAGAVLAWGLAPTAMAQGNTVRIQHAQGETAVPAAPKKVLVYDLAALDTLTALGVQVAGVPSGPMPPQLAAYADRKFLKIGTLFEPDFEAVNNANPDLIIVAGRSAPKYAELSRLAPTLDLTVDPKDFLASVFRNTRTLGKVFGREAQAEALVARTQASIAALNTRAAGAGRGLILLTTGGKLSVYGPGSRFGVIHDSLGFAPALPDLKVSTHGQAASFEFVLQTNPDWLFVIDRDAAIGREGAAAQRLLDNELVRKTTAWQKKQVVYLNSANWYSLGGAGMAALQANIDQLSAALAAAH